MKILYLGDLAHGQTCRMRMRALERLGHEVRGVDTVRPWKEAAWAARQWQRRVGRGSGSIAGRINRDVLAAAREVRPKLVWADKQEHLRAETLGDLAKLGARTVHFTPDPYFSVAWKRSRVMDEALEAFDGLVYCKLYEQQDYEQARPPCHYLPLGYCDETHRPLHGDDARWACAVGFLGGWDPRRERDLAPVAAAGIDLTIRGGYWDFVQDGRWTPRRHLILRQLAGGEPFHIRRNPALACCLRGGEVYGDDYARALTGARIGIGFLRRVWPDQHTTRTFEIPACGSLLLADRTEEHQELFEEGKEADYFDSAGELLDKVRFYTANEAARAKVAASGYQRCVDSGYSYVHRMKTAMEWVEREVL